MTTALQLLEKGFRVKIYAKEFPHLNSFDKASKNMESELIASQVAAGFIMRFSQL